jgi:peptidoglycan/LPS O-acetylase OafA/YrhL
MNTARRMNDHADDNLTPPGNGNGFLAHFRRITSSGQFIPEIDGLRFVAVSLIVVYHVLVFVCNSQDREVGGINRLARGVEMFYVLSGFVLALPFAAQFLRGEKPVQLKGYFIRRLTRLEPPYLICLVIYTILKLLQNPNSESEILRNALLASVYMHNTILGRPRMIISVGWSLELEVQFYLMMPLLAYVFLIRPKLVRRALMIGVILLTPIYQPIWFHALYYPNDGHLLNFPQYFFAGLLLADIWVVEWSNAPPPAKSGWFSWGDMIWPLCIPLLLSVPRDFRISDKWWLAPIVFLMYLGMFRSIWVRRLMQVQVITIIGGMCYSIYLIHNLVIGIIGNWMRNVIPASFLPAVLISSVVMIPAALFASAVYFRLIERPCMRRDWPMRLKNWFVSHLFVEEKPAENP